MRVGIMLRHFGSPEGGVQVYTRALLEELFALGTGHEFVLVYDNPKYLGQYRHPGVREVTVRAYNKLTWDQWAVPRLHEREKFDVIFNPKYSVPLATECPSVFVAHGLDWYVMPQASKIADRISHRLLIPLYARKATKIIAVSESTRQDVLRYLPVKPERVVTVHHGLASKHFERADTDAISEVRAKYRLPARFLLFVSHIYPPKNLGGLVRAYMKVGPELGLPLIIVGSGRFLYAEDLNYIDRLNTPWIKRLGTLPAHEVGVIMQLAHALLQPSLYEAFGMTVLEAMAKGCPVLTADRHGVAEIGGNAALLVNPEDVDAIADGIQRVSMDDSLRCELVRLGYERARSFNWTTCARATLDVIESAAAEARREEIVGTASTISNPIR